MEQVFFLGMGLVALAKPEFVVGLFGTKTLNEDGRSEVRAVYGGFGCGVAILLKWAESNPIEARGIHLAIAVAMMSMAAGRLISFAIDRKTLEIWPMLFFLVELGLGTFLIRKAKYY